MINNNDLKYVTVREMKEIDRYTIEECGVPASALMENAGKAVAEEVKKIFSEGTVFIFCGYGNNGGDGMVAARYLWQERYQVKVFLVGKPKPFSPETEVNFQALKDLGCPVVSIKSVAELKGIFPTLSLPCLVIDAIFGIGIRGVLDDFYLLLIKKINSLGCPIVAVDIPSGLEGDTGEPLGVAVKATKTVTMGYPKVGFKNPTCQQFLGTLVVADIGLKRPNHLFR